MTAEIAILNKTAVALAADSAVTISAGSSQEKIYDSADKLFELSDCDPIGIMINNDMNFMETPLPVLIKRYRSKAPRFSKVEEAATNFLSYLHDFGRNSPEPVKLRHLVRHVTPLVNLIQDRSQRAMADLFNLPDNPLSERPFAEVMGELAENEINVVRRALQKTKVASFMGDGELSLSEAERTRVAEVVEETLTVATDAQRVLVCQMIVENIERVAWSTSTTGVIVAGFGGDEIFPTVVSFELFGTVGSRLKFIETNMVDIDRDGHRARVLPFAQREMVERFLYGLDNGIERKIEQFVKSSVPNIRNRIIEGLDMTEADRSALIAEWEKAELGFFDGLASESFAAIREQSQTEIEDMVEFMPISEMAKMAEALVNLTSIKRRVSRGMETVGGPIDVAVISRSDGFVWVRRKHYFPPELNNRYFERIRSKVGENRESEDDKDLQSGDAGA
jgi:hypothetical protein